MKKKNYCLDKINFYLNSIKKNLDFNSFINVYSNSVKYKSIEIDKKIFSNSSKELAGIVFGLKDLICYKNYPIQAGSKILMGFVSSFSSTVVKKIIQNDGLIIGHQNCDEFGMGSSGENSVFGSVLNPFDKKRVSGGSSSGSVVSIKKDMCCVSIASDTGGSVRQPSSFCGVIGIKPTYSKISRHGLISYSSSFDTIGIISKSILKCAKVLKIISGSDDFDNTSSLLKIKNFNFFFNKSLDRKYKIAYIQEMINNKYLKKDIKQKTLSKLYFLKKNGHYVDKIKYNLFDYMLPVYYILTSIELSSNLSRFDGIRYGYINNTHSTYYKVRTHGFSLEVKKRILLGTSILSSKYYNFFYLKAQKIRNMIKKTTRLIFNKYDFIISPTTPINAFKIGESIKNPFYTYLSDLYTVHASLSGIPAISIPNGFDQNGLPIGLQIMSDIFQEKKLLSFSNYLIKS